MIKDVVIRQVGVQFLQAEDYETPMETVNPGEYYFKNGSHYLLFDEVTEGFQEPSHVMMKFSDRRLLVRKRGLVNVEMVFEREKHTVTYYETPFGRIKLGLAASSFRLKETLPQIDLHLDYALSLNDAFYADCQIHIIVQPRLNGMFSLSDPIQA